MLEAMGDGGTKMLAFLGREHDQISDTGRSQQLKIVV